MESERKMTNLFWHGANKSCPSAKGLNKLGISFCTAGMYQTVATQHNCNLKIVAPGLMYISKNLRHHKIVIGILCNKFPQQISRHNSKVYNLFNFI